MILALDTTARAGSCAVLREGGVAVEYVGDASRELAVRLPKELVAVLERTGATLTEVDAFAVATGPGSFTGLRIGIATMQGIAFAMGKPLIGISAFDALAAIAGQTGPTIQVATWVDAWRGDVFAALYPIGRLPELPVVMKPNVLLERLRGVPTLFIGDGAARYADLVGSEGGPSAAIADPVTPPLAGTIARLALAAYLGGNRPGPQAIRPLYVRRPDAVMVRDARTKSAGAHAE